jgi:hypothetical protein
MEMGNPELVKRICICICKSHGGSTAARINRFAFIYDRLVGALVSKLYVRGLLVRKKYCIRAGTAEKMIFALMLVMRENNTVYASTSPNPKPQSQSITNQQTLCMCQSEDVALYLLYVRS